MPVKGRFRTPLHPEAMDYSSSLEVDSRLFQEDIQGSIAHVRMLGRQRILPARQVSAIVRGLKEILKEYKRRSRPDLAWRGQTRRFADEDIHMAIEQRLVTKVGAVAGALHTARSRNDQVALDERLYLRRTTRLLQQEIRTLQRALVAKAQRYADTIMPGYTHLQRGQPVLLAHHLLAYVSMLDRDHGRLADCLRRGNRSPLGAAALAGTSFPIDRKAVARELGFAGVVENSIDAVSDRDMLIEFLAACAIIMMHLSRFGEELVLWSSAEWGFATIGEEFTTGSSIMPQKANPDMAELVRGKTGRVYGDLIALLTVMKGLPLAYNRDLQEDKEPLFDAADTVRGSLRVAAMMLKSTSIVGDRFERELRSDMSLATEVADYLARKGMPFRKAHSVAGLLVRLAQERGLALRDLPLKEYQTYSSLFQKDLYQRLTPRGSIGAKRSAGSTSPRHVRSALAVWKRRLGT